mmetsp:Transcript_64881/g.154938  ORF Transcript_64881/g.154938 Transcript_64881/m.154938 type:complete len:207 (-) Transcript_64881:2576-3196(-)
MCLACSFAFARCKGPPAKLFPSVRRFLSGARAAGSSKQRTARGSQRHSYQSLNDKASPLLMLSKSAGGCAPLLGWSCSNSTLHNRSSLGRDKTLQQKPCHKFIGRPNFHRSVLKKVSTAAAKSLACEVDDLPRHVKNRRSWPRWAAAVAISCIESCLSLASAWHGGDDSCVQNASINSHASAQLAPGATWCALVKSFLENSTPPPV